MNSFDQMIEKYKKELIDAKGRSITDAIEEASEATQETASETVEKAFEDEETEKAKDEEEIKTEVNEEKTDTALNEAQNEDSNNEAECEATGSLKVQVFAANAVYPVSSALVTVYKSSTDEKVFEGYTNTSGIVEPISLCTVLPEKTDAPSFQKPFSQYDILVEHPCFVSAKYIGAPIFENIESIQTVSLVPVGSDNNAETMIFVSEPNGLLLSSDKEAANG